MTCVSCSGETIAIVRQNEFLVYKPTGGQYSKGKPKYVGRSEPNGDWVSGLDGPHLTNHGQIHDGCRIGFDCAAVSDTILATGISGSRCLMLFSVAEEPRLGRCIFKLEAGVERRILTILFNNQNTELAVLYSLPSSHLEVWQFQTVATLPSKTMPRKASAASDVRENAKFAAPTEVVVDMTFKHGNQQPARSTRDAKFSHDGQKIVSCTAHAYGTALVCILSKDDQNQWRLWGRRQIHCTLHNWDEDCLGFTGVAL
jgi:hypothetical protein